MTPSIPPKCVVFDLMQVLLRWEPERLYARLIPNAEERGAFFKRVGLHAVNAQACVHGDLRGRVAALAQAYPADAQYILAWWDRWPEMCHATIPEMVQFLEQLQTARITVCALSNFSDDAFIIAQQRYPALRQFDVEIISSRVGIVKPDPRIYAIVEQRTGFSGADILFIDDKAENVEAALARGWSSHVFTNWDNFSVARQDYGLDALT